jgi:hypothetical protein
MDMTFGLPQAEAVLAQVDETHGADVPCPPALLFTPGYLTPYSVCEAWRSRSTAALPRLALLRPSATGKRLPSHTVCAIVVAKFLSLATLEISYG